ncbi:MAG: 50S ribosomal protein L37Ae [Promethearchaeota archaeon CR_4]|nr:MAG: 50S ribosomal protein L37Ae [Candidatus Lokiarchaeota archaeon CR_4]
MLVHCVARAHRTKKAGITARFGPRYGDRLRKRVLAIEQKEKGKIKCPKCENHTIKRLSTGVWHCNRCGAKMTGGAWELHTAQGRVAWRVAASKTQAEKK